MPFNFPRFLFELFRFYDASFLRVSSHRFSHVERVFSSVVQSVVSVVSNHSSIGPVPHLFVHPNRVFVARSNEQIDEVRVVKLFRDAFEFFHQFVGDVLSSKRRGDGHCGHVSVEETSLPFGFPHDVPAQCAVDGLARDEIFRPVSEIREVKR